jgi:hypothetical protein
MPSLPVPSPGSIPLVGPLLVSAWRLLDTTIDVVVADVVRRVDVDAVARRLDVAAVLDRLDLTDVVLQRVDLQRLVREVLGRLDQEVLAEVVALVDVDAVAARLDVESVLDRVDLTTLVLERVDLGAVVDAALAKIDLVGLAEQVIDGVDLPEIIRESTGSMASETVRGVRMRGIEADQTVSRAVDRLFRSRRSLPGAT